MDGKVRLYIRDAKGRFTRAGEFIAEEAAQHLLIRDDLPLMPPGWHVESPENRFWFDVEIEIEEYGKWLITKVGFPTLPEEWEIYQAALQEQLRRMRQSPQRFGITPDDLQNTELIRVISAGRTF